MKNALTKKSIFVSLFCLGAVGILFLSNQTARAENPSAAWPTIQLQQFAMGFSRPVHITNADDGSHRLFIVEQSGAIGILLQNGSTLSTPFLDISDRVLSSDNGGGGEEGLLSVAFPPDYDNSGLFYVYYTNMAGDNRVSRFSTSKDSNLADPDSEELIILLEHPFQTNHNGGQLVFGNDGYLYIGTGDGGGGGDPYGNAQNPASLLGKLLRIDVAPLAPVTGPYHSYLPIIQTNGQNNISTTPAYRIPPDNPFVDVPGYRPEIWALGLRNPWRFSFDRLTHDLWIGDVGQGQYEEIDYQPASGSGGENYGWNIMEGTHCYNSATCDQTGLTLPVAEYNHDSGRCSVTGGYVYRGAIPSLQGIYFYGDFCSGHIWGLQFDGGWLSQDLLSSGRMISSFGESENGDIFLSDLSNGTIYQITVGNP